MLSAECASQFAEDFTVFKPSSYFNNNNIDIEKGFLWIRNILPRQLWIRWWKLAGQQPGFAPDYGSHQGNHPGDYRHHEPEHPDQRDEMIQVTANMKESVLEVLKQLQTDMQERNRTMDSYMAGLKEMLGTTGKSWLRQGKLRTNLPRPARPCRKWRIPWAAS